MGENAWSVVIPVKGGAAAKTRLGLEPAERMQVAAWLAERTVTAAVEAARVALVVVVTSDPDMAGVCRRLGATVVDQQTPGLAGAVASGVHTLAQQRPDAPAAVLLGDVPALQPGDLDAALGAGSALERSFVADAEDVGTVLLMARTPLLLVPRFGGASAAEHEAAGHERLDAAALFGASVAARLQRDVDTAEQLAIATAWTGSPTDAAGVGLTQATVRTGVHADGTEPGGTVVLDDGRELPFAAALLLDAGLRRVGPGQRLTVRLDPSEREVVSLRLGDVAVAAQAPRSLPVRR